MNNQDSLCPTCEANIPSAHRFCWRCGTDSVRQDRLRTSSFAIHPGEPVNSLNVVSTILPIASGDASHAFKLVLFLAVTTPVVLALFGFVGLGIVCAAISIPVMYLVFFQDTNEWKEHPILVTTLVVGISTGLGAAAHLVLASLTNDEASIPDNFESFNASTFFAHAISALTAVVIAQIGPILLVRRPQFDDLIDGLIFGIAAGSSFAAGQTLAASWKFIATSTSRLESADVLNWIFAVVEFGFLKPLIYGAVIGLVVAAFSGSGEGPGHPSPRYFRTIATSVAIVLTWHLVSAGIAAQLSGAIRVGANVSWSCVVTGFLLIRARKVLHLATIEAASQAIADGRQASSSNRGLGFCPECTALLVDGSMFCGTCGTSVRAHSVGARNDITTHIDLSALTNTIGIHRGGSNLKGSSSLLAIAAVAGITTLGACFMFLANVTSGARATSLVKVISPTDEPVIDVDLPALNPIAGPSVAPTPTTLAEMPISLDTVATESEQPDPESAPTNHPASLVGGDTPALFVLDGDGTGVRLPLPGGWVDLGGGRAKSSTDHAMTLAISAQRKPNDVVLANYRDKELGGQFTDFVSSKFKILNTASYSTIGYFTYTGSLVDDNGSRRIFGFVWIGTTLDGTTWTVNWQSDFDVDRKTIDSYFQLTTDYFEAHLSSI